jgi:tRNA nucleotidyltransferase (CCA-adding enzyme)
MNLARQIEQYLPQQFMELVKDISKKATGRGQKVYLVGGIVRDMLLGYPNFDIDLVVEGEAIKLAEQVAETSKAKLLVHRRFGTAKLKYDNFTVDLATARKETYTRSGALPTVTPGTIKDDLIRRDFSINAMAVSLASDDYGELVDPYSGKSDLERHLIRILHPESFSDDATRILRGVCYEQRFGFEFEPETARLLKRDIPMLDTISGDRIRHELEHIFEEKLPELVIKRLGELGVLCRIDPSLRGNGWIANKFDKARSLKKSTQLPSLYFCLLIYSFNETEVEQTLDRLNVPVKLSRAMRDTLGLKARLCLLDKSSLKPSDIYYLLQDYEPIAIQVNAIASEPTTIHHRLQLFLKKLRYVRTSMDGEELKGLGISAGPEMGKVLRILHKAKLDGEVRTSEDEKKLALSLKAGNFNTEPECLRD